MLQIQTSMYGLLTQTNLWGYINVWVTNVNKSMGYIDINVWVTNVNKYMGYINNVHITNVNKLMGYRWRYQ